MTVWETQFIPAHKEQCQYDFQANKIFSDLFSSQRNAFKGNCVTPEVP